MAQPPPESEPVHDPESEPTGRYPISGLRKVLLLAFVLGFWIFYFWYSTSQDKSPAGTPPPAPLEQKSSASPASSPSD